MRLFFIILILLVLYSCSTTKNIPQGCYLLNRVEIKSDSKDVNTKELKKYIRQNPNTKTPVFGKVGLHIYNIAGSDSAQWWGGRFIRKIGQDPVIYSQELSSVTAEVIQNELSNQGYLDAQVSIEARLNGQKADVAYMISASERFRISSYDIELNDPVIDSLIRSDEKKCLIRPGIFFDKSLLESERQRVASWLNNSGYYSANANSFYFEADSVRNTAAVEVRLKMADSTMHRYHIGKVEIESLYMTPDSLSLKDTVRINEITIIRDSGRFLNDRALLPKNKLIPGELYSAEDLSRTYQGLSELECVRQTEIQLTPVGRTDTLEAKIIVKADDVHAVKIALDGTQSAGNLGVAPSLTYSHSNIFNGAEVLSLKLKGSYEYLMANENSGMLARSYYEYGAEASLTYPRFLFPFIGDHRRNYTTARTKFTVSPMFQNRYEYKRQYFSADMQYIWKGRNDRFVYSFDMINIDYIRMPWMSDQFKEQLDNAVFDQSYQDQFIASNAFGFTYKSRQDRSSLDRNGYTITFFTEIAGPFPSLIKYMGGAKVNDQGQSEILGIPYAQYWKNEAGVVYNHKVDKKNEVAIHFFCGVARPFGNSEVMPYEKRYFSGGANSVRGWSVRTLGPGSFKNSSGTSFVNHTGDIKLDMSVEYRAKLGKYFEWATFVDAGNIWTIKEYQGQEGGRFYFSEFYKEIACSYGAGLRFDLGLVLFRLDVGIRAYDPGLDSGKRFILFSPKASNTAWHFAIGYPF